MNNQIPTTKCAECGGYAYDAVVAEDVKVRHDGKWYTLQIPNLLVSKCEKCGAIYRDNRADDQIRDALRSHLEVLKPV